MNWLAGKTHTTSKYRIQIEGYKGKILKELGGENQSCKKSDGVSLPWETSSRHAGLTGSGWDTSGEHETWYCDVGQVVPPCQGPLQESSFCWHATSWPLLGLVCPQIPKIVEEGFELHWHRPAGHQNSARLKDWILWRDAACLWTRCACTMKPHFSPFLSFSVIFWSEPCNWLHELYANWRVS